MPGPTDLLYSVTPMPAGGAFTWADIANQVARWDANVPGSITESFGVTQVADQVSTYDLDLVVVTEDKPTYDASDAVFGGAGSITHPSGVDSLRSQLPDTSQAFTVWGVMAPGQFSADETLWSAQASGPRLLCTAGDLWEEGYTSWQLSSDGTNFRNGSDVWVRGGAFLFIAYFNGASSYLIIDGNTVTLDGTTVGTTMITDLYLVASDQAWSILGVVSGEIDSTTRDNMLALARTERGVPAAWSPDYLAPTAWYRADLGHATSDGNPMSAWANQGIAGSDGDLQQGTGGNQPTYDASHASFNNQAVIDFDGGDVLYATAGTWWHLPTESSSFSLVSVARTESASGAEEIAITRAYSSVGGFRQAIRAAGACVSNAEESGGVATIADNGANGTQNAVHVLASVLTGAVTTSNDTLETLVDGASSGGTGGDLDLAVSASANRELCIGGTNTTTGALNGQIAEILFCKRLLTAAEDAALTSYVNTRYGLALSGVTQ